MDLYITSLLLGVVGLGAMAVSGLGSPAAIPATVTHGHGGHAVTAVHGHAAGRHTRPVMARRTATATAPRARMRTRARRRRAERSGRSCRRASCSASPSASALAGELLRPMLGGPLLFAGARRRRRAVRAAASFRRSGISRCVSRRQPADDARERGHRRSDRGHVVRRERRRESCRSRSTDRSSRSSPRFSRTIVCSATRVRAGQRVRIDDVNAEKNSCTVSII